MIGLRFFFCLFVQSGNVFCSFEKNPVSCIIGDRNARNISERTEKNESSSDYIQR